MRLLRQEIVSLIKKRCFSSLAINKKILTYCKLLPHRDVIQKRGILFKMNNDVPNRIVGYYVL